MDNINELKEALLEAQNKSDSKAITACRGRLIKALKTEINKLAKNKDNPLASNEELLTLKAMLDEELSNHKSQIANRYKQEFVKKTGGIISTITTLPKGIALQAQKVVACINQLKEAKTNKERIFGSLEALKESGLLIATPVIATGKFVVKHWYLLLIAAAYVFNIPGYLVDKAKGNFMEGGSLAGDLKETMGNNDELSEILNNGLARIKDLPETMSHDFQAAKELVTVIKDKFDIIKYAIGQINLDSPFDENFTIGQKLNEIVGKINSIDLSDNKIAQVLLAMTQELDELIERIKGPSVNMQMSSGR